VTHIPFYLFDISAAAEFLHDTSEILAFKLKISSFLHFLGSLGTCVTRLMTNHVRLTWLHLSRWVKRLLGSLLALLGESAKLELILRKFLLRTLKKSVKSHLVKLE
jgi:threonine/homoserine/homoserine lactone efflux protein